MSGQTMTIKEIADFCLVDVKTIRRWLDKVSRGDGHNVQPRPELKERSMSAGELGDSARFYFDEVIAIIEAGGKKTLAALLADKAKVSKVAKVAVRATSETRLPSGAQIEALRKVYGSEGAGHRLDFIIGYNPMHHLPQIIPQSARALASQPVPAISAPKAKRMSLLDHGYPIKNLHQVAAIIGKDPEWTRRESLRLGHLREWDKETMYFLMLKANSMNRPHNYSPNNLDAYIREMEAVL